MKQSKNSVLTCVIVYAMFWQVIVMFTVIFVQAVSWLNERAQHTDRAWCRTGDGKLNEGFATR
jgi:hypothetical protein